MTVETRALVLAPALMLAACASVPVDAGFDEAAAMARERGGLELAWRRGGPEEAELDRRAHELLAEELTADGAVQVALLSNRRLQALYAELGFAQADVLEASRIPNPLFHAELRFPEGGGLTALDLGIEQSFLELLFLPLRKRLAAEAFEAAKLRVTAGALELAGETRAGFWRAQGSAQLLELRRTALDAAEASLELAQRLFEAGNIRSVDLELQEAQREDARVALADAELAALEAREALVAILGLHGDDVELAIGERLPELPAEAGSPADMEARAIESSLSLAVTRHEIERAARVLGLDEKTRFVPGLELGVAAERESEGDWSVGPSLALPLPIFSQGQPELRRAAAELERLRATYQADAVELRSRVRTSAARVLALHARASFLRDTVVPLRARILDSLQLEYNAMQTGAFTLLLAKREELGAAADLVTSLTDYWVASSELDTLLEGAELERSTSTRLARSPGRSPTSTDFH